MMQNSAGPIQMILTDIEGTTTRVSFVHDVLFPYAARHLAEFVQHNEHDPAVKAVLEAVKKTLIEEGALSQGLELNDCVGALKDWITTDRKHPALKTLQGMIWKAGYEEGAYQAHVYDEVPSCLQHWFAKGLKLGVFSSGSIAAQKLLFAHTIAGDLTPLFTHYFDLSVGSKREIAAYENIALVCAPVEPQAILFLSDIPEELAAAQASGFQVAHIVREGTSSHPDFPSIPDFHEITARFLG